MYEAAMTKSTKRTDVRMSAAESSKVARPKPKQSAANTTPRRVPSPRCTDVSKDVPT